jgi:hypothetical protein
VREARSRLYRATVRDTDDRFAALLSRLRALGRYQDALVVLVGDHGEEFGEHGDVSHGRTLYQEQLHVPLAIKLPGGAGGGVRIGTPVSTADVAGTLLAELGVTAGAGRTLPLPGGEPAPPAPIFSDLDLDGWRAESAVAWPWKYLRQGGQGARLFDLAADPEERRDAAADQPERLAELSAAVQHRRSSSARGLWLDCSAGTRRARVILELALDPLPAERETLGLEPSDRVRVVDGGLRVEWELKPGAAFSEVELLDARAQARSQPDRDRLRLDPGAARALRVRSSGDALRLESAAGEALPGDGTPIPLADLASAGGAAPAVPGVRPICRLLHRAPGVDRVPEEAMSEALRERLRALGYLEE